MCKYVNLVVSLKVTCFCAVQNSRRLYGLAQYIFSQQSLNSITGVTILFDTESYVLVQKHAKGYQFDTHTSEIKIC